MLSLKILNLLEVAPEKFYNFPKKETYVFEFLLASSIMENEMT